MAKHENIPGSVASLFRYPVKSMMGEEISVAEIGTGGVAGDRVYALIDTVDGKVVSAKNPRKWPDLFNFRARFLEPPHLETPFPPVLITLPDGTLITTDQEDYNQMLSRALQHAVTLDTRRYSLEKVLVNAEEYWPDIENLEHRDTITDFTLPEGTFYDCAVIHLLTTSTLRQLNELYPWGRFEARRFRPNILVETGKGQTGFIENAWVGHRIIIGNDVLLHVTGPCPRCVMTTLPQGDLPKDLGILATAATYNHANVGVYCSVISGGTIRSGDTVQFD